MNPSVTEEKFKRVYVEIGNICNLQCSFCPEVEKRDFQIELEPFRKVLLQVREHTERVCFHLMGEPTFHPLFPQLVDIAHELSVKAEITTNGTRLAPEIEAALLKPAVVQVNFSLQSFFDNFPKADPQTYLQKIFSFTRQAMSVRPDLYINYRLWNLVSGETSINELVFCAIEREFGVSLNRRVDPGHRKSKRIVQRLYLHFDSRFEWPHLQKGVAKTSGSCYGTRTHVGIHADGSVVPCCLDKEAVISLGNVHEQDLSQILQGEKFLKIKKGFEQGVLVEELCQRCDYARRFN